ncbi:MAG: histidinol dehydrogenase [Proteobacteria bacterium]|nr:histidinol dehydrogenase [Pseudomonadota bacterium]
MTTASPLAWRRLDSSAADFDAALGQLVAFEAAQDPEVDRVVAAIIADVRRRGDAALVEYTARFDRHTVASAAGLAIGADAMHAAHDALPAPMREALAAAAHRIREFHEHQRGGEFVLGDAEGSTLGQRVTPIDRTGIYVPGGKAAYPSSVLMNAIPAQVAGVREIVMAVPAPGGERNPLVLAAAHLAGVTQAFAIGGAQAIAALAYGTETIRPVDKICGPGNAYVAAAKRRVFGTVGIDMVAGASEVLVLADATANPDWVALDLFAQAEHDELAQALLVTPDAGLIERVAASAARLVAEMPRAAIIAASVAHRGALIRVRDLDEACAIANRIAPEHLELAVADPDALLPKIRHAGAIFLGHHACEAFGDYCAGPDHVLPTGRTARFSSPLGVHDFQKRSSILRINSATAGVLAGIASTLARGEGLVAHARSAEARAAKPVATPLGDDAVARDAAAVAARTVRQDVLAMSAYAVPKAGSMIKLDANESPFALPDALRPALAAALAAIPLNRYPDGGADAVQGALRTTLGLADATGLVLGNGSDELIQLITTMVARPGAVVLAPEPTFVMYAIYAKHAGVRYVGVPLDADLELDVGAMLAAIAREHPALVWLASPNNPTGTLFPRDSIERILRAAPGLVVVDEAYCAYARESILGRAQRFSNLLVLRTLSKTGMAGLRLGYAVGDRAWTRPLDALRSPYNLNALTQAAATVLLADPAPFAQQAAAVRAERARLAAALAALPGVRVFPSEANFVLVRVADAGATSTALREAGILVKNVHGAHPLLANCLRITVGTAAENDALIAALSRKP